jgi:L-arabinose isomerase
MAGLFLMANRWRGEKMETIKKSGIGILPLYLKLYDDAVPDLKPRVVNFLNDVIKEIERKGVKVSAAPVCREKKEFEKAIKFFKKEDIDAILTIHLAYSPSLESIDSLAGTDLPVIVLN